MGKVCRLVNGGVIFTQRPTSILHGSYFTMKTMYFLSEVDMSTTEQRKVAVEVPARGRQVEDRPS